MLDSQPIPAEAPLSTPESSDHCPGSERSVVVPPEEHDAMLDVHPAHHAASSWREFFIHIATIVLGLLIAVSLEQTVEYIHHRYLARDAREQLRAERHSDETSNEVNIFTTQRHQRDLQRDLAILRAVRTHAPLPKLPFITRRFRYVYPEDAWRKIHESGTIDFLNRDDLKGLDYRYVEQDAFASRAVESIEALDHAASVLRSENDPPRVSVESSTANISFINTLIAGHFALDEETIRLGYASMVERSDLTQLTPAQIDELERAIKIALADDDALLTYCLNIKRNLQNNPLR